MKFFKLGIGGDRGGRVGLRSKAEQSSEIKAIEGQSTSTGRRKGRGKTEFTSYYGRPVVKKAHWSWEIWLYFWIGGVAGGASAITALFELFGNKKRDRSLIRAGKYISLAGLVVSPVLLIMDLGRPERFFRMLRILKLRSPLSLGTYILSATGLLSGLNTARQIVDDGLIGKNTLVGKLLSVGSNPLTRGLQGLGGLGVGSYTGVLLSATATPLWAEADTTMGPVFLSTALSNGSAAISLALTLTYSRSSYEDTKRLAQIEQVAILGEVSLITYTAFKMKPEVRRAFMKSVHSKGFLIAVLAGQVLPLLAHLVIPDNGTTGRLNRVITSLSVLGGGFLLRYSIIEGGKATVEDPSAYHAITRGKARPSPEEQAKAAMSSKE